MRTLSTFLVIAAVVLTAGCRRNTGPSLEYVEAKGLYDRLIVDLGDDAYVSDEMGEVEALLKKVDPRSPDAAEAKELLATITAERKRVEEEARAADAPEVAPDLRSQFEDDEDERAEAEAEEEGGADAGVIEQPQQGMALAELQRRFSTCFSPGPEMMVQGLGVSQTYVLNQTASCRERHGQFNGAALVIRDNRVAAFARYDPNQRPAQAPQPSAPQGQPTEQPAPQGPYAQPPLPSSDQNVTRPESAPAERGSTREDYDSIRY